MADPLLQLAAALQAAPALRLLIVTGAGTSLASGIPTFRGTDPGAVWAGEAIEIGTADYLTRDPVGWWRWVLKLRRQVLSARPNPAHQALADLERWHTAPPRRGGFLLVTQNVDLLHEQAGSRRLVKVHGTADRLRCSRRGCRHAAPYGSLPASDFDLTPFEREPIPKNLPRCPTCGAVARGHVLLFDELYDEHVDYQFELVQDELARADLVLFVGTSFSVGLTDLVLTSALARRTPLYAIEPAAHRPPPGAHVIQICDTAEAALPRLLAALEAPVDATTRQSPPPPAASTSRP